MEPLTCHILIGPPASGKSTLADQLTKLDPSLTIISTDHIRQDLYGDLTVQGEWQAIEAQVLKRIETSLDNGSGVIYDATNSKRAWRLDLLQKLSRFPQAEWIGWHLCTPLNTCQLWNQQRSRQVPDSVIVEQDLSLRKFPPIAAEGFLEVFSMNSAAPRFLPHKLSQLRQGLPRSLINRQNATQHYTLHRYSRLLDFERLIYLLSVVIHSPGIGASLDPLKPEDPLTQITQRISLTHGAVYADSQALAEDLAWLAKISILGFSDLTSTLERPRPVHALTIPTHAYSDWKSFERLIQVIRCIVNHPFAYDPELGSLGSLLLQLSRLGWLTENLKDAVRKDIEKVLKPYQILPEYPMKSGYFTQTGLFTRQELKQIYRLLQASSKTIEDPVNQATFEMVSQRMRLSQNDRSDPYPVRQLGYQSIVDPILAPSGSLASRSTLELLEHAIEAGEQLEVKRLPGARFVGEEQDVILLWPLQILFHQIAWYLGCEYDTPQQAGLLRFERLDRLFLCQTQCGSRSRKKQESALQRLHQLYDHSAGIFLGNDVEQQRQFLSRHPDERAKAEVVVELWFNDAMFKFVSEGTRRFRHQKMSPKLAGSSHPKSLYSLSPSKDPTHPNRLKVVLPIWSLQDVDLKRWIIGFGGGVKVISPPELQKIIKATGQAITDLYP